jgi:hypothetical protein
MPKLQIYCQIEYDLETGKPYIAEFEAKIHKSAKAIQPKQPMRKPSLPSKCERLN